MTSQIGIHIEDSPCVLGDGVWGRADITKFWKRTVGKKKINYIPSHPGGWDQKICNLARTRLSEQLPSSQFQDLLEGFG